MTCEHAYVDDMPLIEVLAKVWADPNCISIPDDGFVGSRKREARRQSSGIEMQLGSAHTLCGAVE